MVVAFPEKTAKFATVPPRRLIVKDKRVYVNNVKGVLIKYLAAHGSLKGISSKAVAWSRSVSFPRRKAKGDVCFVGLLSAPAPYQHHRDLVT